MPLDPSTSDNTGPLGTPDIMPSPNSDDEKIQENRTLAFLVYKEVWDEFNKWKVEDCRQQLRLLEQPLPPPNVAESTKRLASAFRADLDGSEPGDVEIIYICDMEDDIPFDVSNATVLTCEDVSLKLPLDFKPHPPYESCTASVQTIALRETSAAYEEITIAPFIPYADSDDPNWNIRRYLKQFEGFAWERLADPDVEAIQFEVLRRLHFGHGLSLDDIDVTGVLPRLRQSNRFGLIYQMTQRDELFWPGMMADFPVATDGPERRGINFRAHEPDVNDLRGRIESVIPYFCASSSCIHAYCPLHAKDFPSPPAAVPRVMSNAYPEGASCGRFCFRDIDDTFREDSFRWESSEVDELRCILEIIPDTIPCGLAKLVRRPCREVFIERRRLIPDEKIYPESSHRATAGDKANYRDNIIGWNSEGENISTLYIAPGPCSHIGPCDKNNENCICAQESVHCTRSCHCSITCKHRWRGCRCSKSLNKKPTQTCVIGGNCGCRKMGWECDPTVCECDNEAHVLKRRPQPKSKRARLIRPDGRHFCQNSDIQRGLSAELEIKRAEYGLGCFAVKWIRKDQLIGGIILYSPFMCLCSRLDVEYIGELLSVNDDSDKREILRKHIRLNYSFTLNRHYIIDSARVGNETRYINHGSEKANSTAKIVLVHGEHHIALYASKSSRSCPGRYYQRLTGIRPLTARAIRAGEEILFDYGDAYWK
ncbi:hypothetical protein F5888DRAFT_1909582 [Russula emetica]|nr:hypothetical protein F5888DRAFT_1910600 [Russula emetica]KAF8491320.1 hypothetical protein F5888DRAFT_1909582 [Russula emetica]